MSTELDLGKILFIDDDFDRSEEGIKEVVASLVKKGLPVQYWDGKETFPSHITNSRIIIIDLDLANLGSRSGSEDFYSSAALALKQIPGPFIAIIMAREYQPNDPSNLRSYYKTAFGQPLHGIIATEGIKKEEASDPSRLQKLIVSSIQSEKELNLLLLWEKIADKAKDKAFEDLISKEVTGTILSLVELFCRNVGHEAAGREIVDTIMRLVSQKTVDHEGFKELDKLVRELNEKACETVKPETYPSDQDRSLYNKLMFFTPDVNEGIWTGDIYRTKERSKEENYAMVLTPACDLAQNKPCKILVSFGFAVANTASGGLTENIFPLMNFKENENGIGTLLLDLNNVQSIQKDIIIQKWQKITRLDSPFSEAVLAAYGSLVSRVGTLEINKGDKHLQKSLRRYREKQAQEKAKIKQAVAVEVPTEKSVS
jgi:hypothetical protein